MASDLKAESTTMSFAVSRSATEPSDGGSPSLSQGSLVVTLALAPVAAVGWVAITLLGVAVRFALFREHRTHGTTSLLWGLGFGLFLWGGGIGVGLREGRAIPFALVAGAAIALFIYLRGAALENPPLGQPGVFHRRLVARWLEPTTVPSSPYEIQDAEQKRWLTWFGLPALIAAVSVAIVFGTGQAWILGAAFVAIIVDIGVLIWLTLSSDTNGVADEGVGSQH
jgi:hypothetical protein